MKNYIKKSCFLLLAVAVTFTSCQKNVLEDQPTEIYQQDLVFDKLDSLGVNAERILVNAYRSMPNGYNRIGNNVLDAGSDDALPSGSTETIEYFSNGQLNNFNLPDNNWDAMYAGIHQTNLFLANIDVVPLLDKMLNPQWKAEARILRAMFYFELIKRFGGVPLIGDKIFNINESTDLKRNTYDECVNYIISEINAVLPDLVVDQSSANYGRMTKGAAMALKARVLLYAASPLNNPSNNLQKWQAAADAANDVIKTGKYSLTPEYVNVFKNRTNVEVILQYLSAPNSNIDKSNGPIGSLRGDQGKTNPTQELVNAFEMKNGKMIDETGSGYDAANPYNNRDPRFDETINYNGKKWLNRVVETFDGGVDRPIGYGKTNTGETRTGYYMSKFLNASGTENSYTNAEHNFPIFRYAEILLNYAEALNESQGPVAEVYASIEAIRERAGLNPYNLPTGLTKDEMRLRIQHERRVEMAFEEQRFWDIRRWKIAGKVLNGTLHGVQITTSSDSSLTYKTVDAAPVQFNESKMYLYPIPYSVIIGGKNMQQNPNW